MLWEEKVRAKESRRKNRQRKKADKRKKQQAKIWLKDQRKAA